MRNLVFAINVSIDGCCDHTASIPDDEVLDYFTRLTRETDVLLYGRKTYQLMVPYWPEVAKANSGHTKAESDFAQAFLSVPQTIVVSKSLSESENKSVSISREIPKDEIRELKQGQGGIILTGGVSLPSELIALGLI